MSEELHAKYQKLATAYAEVKQKNAVLKSAVQELTQKQGQGSAGMGGGGGNSSLKVSQLQKKMKEGEQALRVQAQDMDALRFHNQQVPTHVLQCTALASQIRFVDLLWSHALPAPCAARTERTSTARAASPARTHARTHPWRATHAIHTTAPHDTQLTKRVEVLQEEENRRSAEKGGKKKKGTAEVEAMHLQEEELRRKIRENEQLHRKMGEMKRESDREIRQLKEQLQTVQRTLKSGDESRRTVAEEAQRSRENVHKESAGLIERIGVLEIELQTSRTGHRTSLTDIEAKLSRTETDNQRLRRLAANQRGKHGFDDIAHAAFNELNVPVVDLFKQRGVDQIKKEAQVSCVEIVGGWSRRCGRHSVREPARMLTRHSLCAGIGSTVRQRVFEFAVVSGTGCAHWRRVGWKGSGDGRVPSDSRRPRPRPQAAGPLFHCVCRRQDLALAVFGRFLHV
eukprot:m.309521 g.309521  ORF g.309521 m.309521 type:complete len:455 (+) comp27425_c0_seq25:61-1425(+)